MNPAGDGANMIAATESVTDLLSRAIATGLFYGRFSEPKSYLIDDNSPLYRLQDEDLKNADVELYVTLRGFDDVFSNYLQQRAAYTFNKILFKRKFVRVDCESDDGESTILELHKLNEHL